MTDLIASLTLAKFPCFCDSCHRPVSADDELVYKREPAVQMHRFCADEQEIRYEVSWDWRKAQARLELKSPGPTSDGLRFEAVGTGPPTILEQERRRGDLAAAASCPHETRTVDCSQRSTKPAKSREKTSLELCPCAGVASEPITSGTAL